MKEQETIIAADGKLKCYWCDKLITNPVQFSKQLFNGQKIYFCSAKHQAEEDKCPF